MLAQRTYGLVLGYEDLKDYQQVAGKSTLSRMELVPDGDTLAERYCRISYSAEAIDELLVTLFLEPQAKAPRHILLDLGSTDVPRHGPKEKSFFHGYYDHCGYLPLAIFCGDHLPRARLRPATIDCGAGRLDEVRAVVAQVRTRWPKTQILLRGDSGFCRDELMSWCEANGVDYVTGFARNDRLPTLIEPQMRQAQAEHRRTGKAARVFTEFEYETRGSWRRTPRWWPKSSNWRARRIRSGRKGESDSAASLGELQKRLCVAEPI